MEAQTIDTIIWAVSLFSIAALVLRHFSKLAELEDEGKTRREEERTARALGVVRAENASVNAEYAALNNGFGSGDGSDNDFSQIMALMNNPAVAGFLKNLKGGGSPPLDQNIISPPSNLK